MVVFFWFLIESGRKGWSSGGGMCVGCKWFDSVEELVQGVVRSVVQFWRFLCVCGVCRSDLFCELLVKGTSFCCN